MFKKYHVGEFISDYMDALDINDTTLSRLSGVSRNHIIRIKNGDADLNVETAISLALYLNVPSSFLMNLQIEFKLYENNIKVLNKFKLKNLGEEFKELIEAKPISLRAFEYFEQDPKRYLQDLSVVHYQPAKSKNEKNFILIQSLNGFEMIEEEFNKKKLKEYLDDEYIKEIADVKRKEDGERVLETIKTKLSSIGINIKIINTNIKTTIKGISRKIGNQINILIEDNRDFADIIWYITHELVHLILDKNATEEEVNMFSQKILIGENFNKLTEVNEDTFKEYNDENVNIFLLYKSYLFLKNKKNEKYEQGDKRYILKL